MNVHEFIQYRMEKTAGETKGKGSATIKPVVSKKGAGVKMKDLSLTANPVGKINPVTGQHKKSTAVSLNKKISPNLTLSATGKSYSKYSPKYDKKKTGYYGGLKLSGKF